MKVLVFEYLCAGDMGKPLDEKISVEGEAILSRLLNDFQEVEGMQVMTILHKRIYDKYGSRTEKLFPADDVVLNRDQDPGSETKNLFGVGEVGRSAVFLWALDDVDLVLFLAPESYGILLEFTLSLERKGAGNLGSTSGAIRAAGNKWLAYRRLTEAGCLMPNTLSYDSDNPPRIDMIDFPVIVKPRMGAGAELLFFQELDDLQKGRSRIKCFFKDRELIVQEFHSGTPASVSAISNGREAMAISLNLQKFDRNGEFRYTGGRIGIDHPMRDAVFEMVKQLPGIFPGLRGYFGVDILLSEKGFEIVEVNPRLTTSYVGLSPHLDVNMIQLILEATLEKRLPSLHPKTEEFDFRLPSGYSFTKSENRGYTRP